MSRKQTGLLALAYVLTLWVLFTWPLAQHIFTGIPCSASATDNARVLRMVPGEHLNQLFGFRLLRDVVSARAPLLQNPYEYFDGEGSASLAAPGLYGIPASLIFIPFSMAGGDAFGWNVSLLACVLIGFAAGACLARRFSDDAAVVLWVSAAGLLLPFVWINLLGGESPGFGFIWVTVILLGLDQAMRSAWWPGSLLAGFGVLCAALTDVHVFLFSLLVVPGWCLMVLLAMPSHAVANARNLALLPVRFLPFVLMAIAGAAILWWHTNQMPGGAMVQIQHWMENRAPDTRHWAALFSRDAGDDAVVLLGLPLVVLLGAGFVSMMVRPPVCGCPPWRARLFVCMLYVGMAAACLFALGPAGAGAGCYGLLTMLCPPLTLVQHPSLVFCILPALLSLAAVLGVTSLLSWIPVRPLRSLGLIALAAMLVMTGRAQVQTGVCRLDNGNDAYRMIAQKAAERGRTPQVLAIPLLPDDAARLSVYRRYASLHGIRMLNGSGSDASGDNVEDICARYESANKGVLTATQIDALRQLGIDYITLHENAFSENVSPFPAAFTLQNLFQNPELELIAESGPVRSFQVLEPGGTREDSGRTWPTFFPRVMYDLRVDGPADSAASLHSDPGGWKGTFCRPANRGDIIHVAAENPVRLVATERLRWMLRVRGNGEANCTLLRHRSKSSDPEVWQERLIRVNNPEWTWTEVPVDRDPENDGVSLRIQIREPGIEFDMALLTAGQWDVLNPGEFVSLPASAFVHAGYSDLKKGCVVLVPNQAGEPAIFSGPDLPLPAGRYRLELIMSSAADGMEELGVLRVVENAKTLADMRMLAGRGTGLLFEKSQNLPLEISFIYSRNAAVFLHRVIITRLPDQESPAL